MSEDFIDKEFSALDEFYPGSKRKRRTTEKPEVTPKADWSAKPLKKYLPNGKQVDMYTLGALADALGRPIITIRLWMKEGYLPSSPYRLPAKPDKNGAVRQGRRLYTKDMIEAAVSIFEKAGLLDTKYVQWSLHRQVTVDIDEAWSKIRAQEIGN